MKVERLFYGFFMMIGIVLGIDGLICAVLGRVEVGVLRRITIKTLYGQPAKVLGGFYALCGLAIVALSLYALFTALPAMHLLYLCLVPMSCMAIANLIGILLG